MASEIERKEVSELASLLGVNKEETLRLALREGIHELRIRKAIELYVSGKASVKQAARFAGLDLAEWFAIAREKNLMVQIRPEELEEDVEALQELNLSSSPVTLMSHLTFSALLSEDMSNTPQC